MKPITSFALLAAIATIGAAGAAATDPVGYITAVIGANPSNNPAGAVTYVSPSLVKPADFTGAANAVPAGSTITFAGGVPTTLDGTSMLEINDGTQEGWWSTIVSSTATSITVADAFPAGLAANVSASVRKFTTVQDVFGNNTAGLTAYNGVVAHDEIRILNPITQATSTIIYAGGAWVDFVTEGPAGGYPIYPGTSVQVVRRGATPLELVTSGTVKTTKTQVDIYPFDNWVGEPIPNGSTLGGLTLATQIAPSDFVIMVRPDPGTGQASDTFVAVGGTMYNFVTEADATGEIVPEGTGFVLRRVPAGTSSIVNIPAPVIAD